MPTFSGLVTLWIWIVLSYSYCHTQISCKTKILGTSNALCSPCNTSFPGNYVEKICALEISKPPLSITGFLQLIFGTNINFWSVCKSINAFEKQLGKSTETVTVLKYLYPTLFFRPGHVIYSCLISQDSLTDHNKNWSMLTTSIIA